MEYLSIECTETLKRKISTVPSRLLYVLLSEMKSIISRSNNAMRNIRVSALIEVLEVEISSRR